MKYEIVRTDTADEGIRKIIMHVARIFGNGTALKKLDEMEKSILALKTEPYLGMKPAYSLLRRQGYRVLILEKDMVFYKVDEERKRVIVHAVTDQREDYLNILRGL